jgi:hypothetical protein
LSFSQAEQLLFSTARVEAEFSDRKKTGTACFYVHRDEAREYPFLVSNRHVVANATNGVITFIAREGTEPRLGEKLTVRIQDFGSAWIANQDPSIDLAILPLAPIREGIQRGGKDIFFISITPDLIPTPEIMQEFDAIEDVVFIGYPRGLFDTVNLNPLVRRGITATPISFDYCGESAFLVDASVFPGSSGSPVFIFNQGTYPIKGMGVGVGSRLYFVGILSRVFTQTAEGKFEATEIPEATPPVAKTREAIDLGYVLKSTVVQDTVLQLLHDRGEIG